MHIFSFILLPFLYDFLNKYPCTIPATLFLCCRPEYTDILQKQETSRFFWIVVFQEQKMTFLFLSGKISLKRHK